VGALKENSWNMSIRVLHPLTAAARDEVEVLRGLPEGSRLNPTVRGAPPLPGRACWVSRRGGTPISAQRAIVWPYTCNVRFSDELRLTCRLSTWFSIRYRKFWRRCGNDSTAYPRRHEFGMPNFDSVNFCTPVKLVVQKLTKFDQA
jgi:hypothetical protein